MGLSGQVLVWVALVMQCWNLCACRLVGSVGGNGAADVCEQVSCGGDSLVLDGEAWDCHLGEQGGCGKRCWCDGLKERGIGAVAGKVLGEAMVVGVLDEPRVLFVWGLERRDEWGQERGAVVVQRAHPLPLLF